jgi:hypothetical protein
MIGLIQFGRWLFIVLALVMGLLVGKFFLLQLRKGASLGPKLFMAIGTAIYFVGAFGVYRWLPWGYPLGIFLVILTVVASAKIVLKTANRGAAIIYIGLWALCLIWFLLPTVRHNFGS